MPVVPCILLASTTTAPAGGPIPVPMDPALLPAGILLITGIFMLLAGRRLLKVGLGITAAVIGGLIGNALGLAFDSALPPIVWTGVGAALGLGLGLLLWRMTVATIMAASCAAVTVLAVALGIRSGLITPVDAVNAVPIDGSALLDRLDDLNSPDDDTGPATLEDAVVAAAGDRVARGWESTLNTAETVTTSWLGTLNDRLSATLGRLVTEWNALDGRMKSALAGVAILGGLFGFLFGLVAWKRSGSIVTVVAGAGLVLIGSLICFESLAPSSRGPFETLHPALWLACWFTLAVGGALIQWHADRQQADTDGEVDS